MNDPRVAKCLSAKRESKSVEFKAQFLPTDARQSLEVLKDIVAIANSGGGTLAIGINNAGECSGADMKPVLGHDHAKYCDQIKKYTMVDFTDFEVIEAKKDGHPVAIFLINAPDSPLVFEKPGTYPIEKGQCTVFSQGTLYFRHGAKSETGTTDDVRKFMTKRIREVQQELMKGLRKVAEAPRGSQIQVIPRGTIIGNPVKAKEAVPVRLTSNPDAAGVIAVNQDEIFPYRQKDVKQRLKTLGIPDINEYAVQAIVRIYGIRNNPTMSWQPQFGSRQYSEAFIEFIVDKIKSNSNFVKETREKDSQLNLRKRPQSRHLMQKVERGSATEKYRPEL